MKLPTQKLWFFWLRGGFWAQRGCFLGPQGTPRAQYFEGLPPKEPSWITGNGIRDFLRWLIALAKLFYNLVIFGNFCIFWPPKAVPIIITLYRKCKKRKSKHIRSQKIQFFVTWFVWKYKIHFCAPVLKLCSPKMFFSKKLKR